MNHKQFTQLVGAQLDRCTALLLSKGDEYAPEADRLAHFKKAGAFLGTSPEQAALGMMTKHLVSISDMIETGGAYTEARWNEKITDAINYLLLIRGLVEERGFAREVQHETH